MDVELIWTRFEKDGPARLLADAGRRRRDPERLHGDRPGRRQTWSTAPPSSPPRAEILRTLIDLFERLRSQEAVVAGRSRIEDGRFVGWLSYPDVLTAQDAMFALRETFRTRGLTIKLQTRDERIPFDWHAEADPPVMSQAS